MIASSKQPITIKPTMVRDLAVYEPSDTLSEEDLFKVLEKISTHTVTIKSLKPKGVFLSFKNIPDTSEEFLTKFVDIFDTLGKSLHIGAGAANYKSNTFKSLAEITYNSSLILAKNLKIAALFLETIRLGKHDNILLFDEDKEAGGILYSEFISHGASVVLAKDKKEFKTKAATNQFAFMIFDSRRNDKNISVTSGFKKGYFFYDFKGYLNDSLLDDFDYNIHKNRLKEGFKAYLFDFSRVTSINKKALAFILKVANDTKSSGGYVYIHSLDKEKLDKESVKKLANEEDIKIYSTLEESFNHAEAKGSIIRTRDLGDKTKIALSKDAIQRITIYVKTILEVFKTYGYNPAEKSISRPSVSAISNLKRDNIGMISFDGDLNATVLLFFTEQQIQFISKSMFGAPTANNDEKKDLLAEVLNTVGGQIKLTTSNMNIPISISLPLSFLKHDDLIGFIEDRKGILVEASFNNEPLQVLFVGSVLLEVL